MRYNVAQLRGDLLSQFGTLGVSYAWKSAFVEIWPCRAVAGPHTPQLSSLSPGPCGGASAWAFIAAGRLVPPQLARPWHTTTAQPPPNQHGPAQRRTKCDRHRAAPHRALLRACGLDAAAA